MFPCGFILHTSIHPSIYPPVYSSGLQSHFGPSLTLSGSDGVFLQPFCHWQPNTQEQEVYQFVLMVLEMYVGRYNFDFEVCHVVASLRRVLGGPVVLLCGTSMWSSSPRTRSRDVIIGLKSLYCKYSTGQKRVFTRSAITPPKVNRFG